MNKFDRETERRRLSKLCWLDYKGVRREITSTFERRLTDYIMSVCIPLTVEKHLEVLFGDGTHQPLGLILDPIPGVEKESLMSLVPGGDNPDLCPVCGLMLNTVLDDYETASRRFIHRYHPTPCVVPNAGARQ